jgi:hypothetical protein
MPRGHAAANPDWDVSVDAGGSASVVPSSVAVALLAVVATFAVATITGAVRRPGVHEVAVGTPFANPLQEAGGLTAEVSAFLVGGYFGFWISAEAALTLRVLDADLDRHGAALDSRAGWRRCAAAARASTQTAEPGSSPARSRFSPTRSRLT